MLARMEARHIGFLPLFVMDSNFAEDGETSRSTDRTISREVVDLTLDNCIAIGDILSKELLEKRI